MAAEVIPDPVLDLDSDNITCRGSSYSKRSLFGIKNGNTFADSVIDLLIVGAKITVYRYGGTQVNDFDTCLDYQINREGCC